MAKKRVPQEIEPETAEERQVASWSSEMGYAVSLDTYREAVRERDSLRERILLLIDQIEAEGYKSWARRERRGCDWLRQEGSGMLEGGG